jgi:hypothetical protein
MLPHPRPFVASLVELAIGPRSASSWWSSPWRWVTSDSSPPSVVGLLRRVSGCVVLACTTSQHDGDHHRDREDPEPQEAIHESGHDSSPDLAHGGSRIHVQCIPRSVPEMRTRSGQDVTDGGAWKGLSSSTRRQTGSSWSCSSSWSSLPSPNGGSAPAPRPRPRPRSGRCRPQRSNSAAGAGPRHDPAAPA